MGDDVKAANELVLSGSARDFPHRDGELPWGLTTFFQRGDEALSGLLLFNGHVAERHNPHGARQAPFFPNLFRFLQEVFRVPPAANDVDDVQIPVHAHASQRKHGVIQPVLYLPAVRIDIHGTVRKLRQRGVRSEPAGVDNPASQRHRVLLVLRQEGVAVLFPQLQEVVNVFHLRPVGPVANATNDHRIGIFYRFPAKRTPWLIERLDVLLVDHGRYGDMVKRHAHSAGKHEARCVVGVQALLDAHKRSRVLFRLIAAA